MSKRTQSPSPMLGRRSTLLLLAASLLVMLGSLRYTFLRFPAVATSLGSGPKAQLASWLGADGASVAYLGLGVGMATVYFVTALLLTRADHPGSPGALCGLALGGVWLTVGVLTSWLPEIQMLSVVSDVALLGVPFVAGMAAGRQRGAVGVGALAGFWCGLIAAPLIAIAIILMDTTFASTLIHSAWSHDRTCPYPAGMRLAACEISDDLGFAATLLTLLPLLSSGLGALGGAIGAAGRPTHPSMPGQFGAPGTPGTPGTPGARQGMRWAGPALFAGTMLTLFCAELIWNLW